MQSARKWTSAFGQLTAALPRLRIPVLSDTCTAGARSASRSIMKQSLLREAYRKGMLRGLGGRQSGRMAEDTESTDGVFGTAWVDGQPCWMAEVRVNPRTRTGR